MSGGDGGVRDAVRSDCYRLLSACFYPPDRRRLIEDRVGLELAERLRELHPGADVAWNAAALLHQDLFARSELELELETDHAALFVGPFALKAAPYGSVYLEGGRRLMGDTTLAARAAYAAAGLTVTLHEPPDHIAIELEFMHFLATRAAEAAHAGDAETAARLANDRWRFLDEHLGAWAPDFCAAVERGAETGFYRALAECLRAFVDAETRESPIVRAEVSGLRAAR